MGGWMQAPAQDGPIGMLASHLAETAADALADAGMDVTGANCVALISALSAALRRVGTERECALRQSRIAQRAVWVQEHRLRTAADTAQRLGLSQRELETARDLAIVAPVEVPAELRATSAHFTVESWQYYWPDLTLTPADRARIAHETLLTRAQSAERLGLPLPAFDRLRLEQGLTPVAQGHDGGAMRRTLYRLEAVDQVRAQVRAGTARAGHPHTGRKPHTPVSGARRDAADEEDEAHADDNDSGRVRPSAPPGRH